MNVPNFSLAANDKAAIMTTFEILKENPDIPHGEIKIAFTSEKKTGCLLSIFQ